jgi:carbonic anhydrase
VGDRKAIGVAVAVAIGLGVATARPLGRAAQSEWRTHWSYDGPTGPAHWGDLDPLYTTCKSGQEQSPIDIRATEKAALPPIRFEYRSAPLRHLVNNGYTIRVNYPAPGSGDFLIVGETRYQLTQFHFHRPSEEFVHGKPADMVAHLMHQSADGHVAGVAVLLNAGAANPVVQAIWPHMPLVEGPETEVAGADINPAGLLPPTTGYYTYMGSSTAPPCTEGVAWFVLKTPVTVSVAEISAFAKLYPHDVRPVQPLNGRVVKESQ